MLSSAPVAALWGPSPVARAGGRCLDVVRLSRITADSPAVVATSSRCQAVLEAMRGRFDTARSLLDASRTTSLELGLDHGLLETSLYAGIVELLADDPAAAEPHLRHAFGGLGQLGIGADAGQAAAHLARALLLQGRLDEADDLAADSDALAGQNLQTAIAARSAQAEILAARGDADAALRWPTRQSAWRPTPTSSSTTPTPSPPWPGCEQQPVTLTAPSAPRPPRGTCSHRRARRVTVEVVVSESTLTATNPGGAEWSLR